MNSAITYCCTQTPSLGCFMLSSAVLLITLLLFKDELGGKREEKEGEAHE